MILIKQEIFNKTRNFLIIEEFLVLLKPCYEVWLYSVLLHVNHDTLSELSHYVACPDLVGNWLGNGNRLPNRSASLIDMSGCIYKIAGTESHAIY